MRAFAAPGSLAFFYTVAAAAILSMTVMTGDARSSESKDADYYFVRGDWKKAASEYEPFITDSAGTAVLLRAAQANYRAGRLERASGVAQRILARENNVAARILQSLVTSEDRGSEEALHELEGLRRSRAEEPQVQTALCEIIRGLDHKRALDHCNKAVEMNPDDFWAWFTMGTIYEEEEAFELATKAYKQAVRINPMNAQAQNNLGYSYKERHYYVYAVEHYRKAIELMPDNPGFHYNIGNAYAHREKVDEAFAAYKKALELDPKFAKAHYNLARMYLRKDMVKEAIGEFELYLEHGNRKIFGDVAPRSAVEDEISDLQLYLKLNPDIKPRTGAITR